MWDDTLTGNVDPSSPISQLHDQMIIWLLTFDIQKRATVEAYVSYNDLTSILVF